MALLLVSAGVASAQNPADLTITKTHNPATFLRGQSGTYTITVSNGAALMPTTAGLAVTVLDALPAGLTATGLTGSGWSCNPGALTCSRTDSLSGGSSYPAITLTVNVAPNAPTPSVTNTASVSGGGEPGGNTGNNTANDPTNISNPSPTTSGINPSQANAGDPSFTLTVNGNNFVSNSVVRWNGEALTTTFVNANQLTAAVDSSRVASAGSATVTVFNPAPGGGTSNGQTFTINQALNITTTSLPNGTPGVAYNQTLTAQGGLLVYVWSLAPGSGPLPTGLSLSPTGTISGTPSAAGTFNFTVRVTDLLLRTDEQVLSITINNPTPTISNLSPSSATAGSGPVPLTITGTNFVSGATVSFGGGSPLPTSNVTSTSLTVTIPASAIMTAGPRSVSVSNPMPGGGASNTLTFTVNNPTPAISSLSPSATTAGLGTFTLTVNGSNFVSGAEVRFDGNMLSTSFVNSTQLTANVPAARTNTPGTFNVTVTNPAPGGGTSAPATFTVNSTVQVTTTSLPAGIFGVQYSQTLAATGGTGAITWSVVSGTLPPGLTLSGSQISGTPTGVGSFSFTVRAADSRGASHDQPLAINILNPVPGILGLSPSAAVAGGLDFVLTVNGPGNSNSFVPSSVVRWNGENLTTRFLSATQLEADVSANRIALAGSASVTVFTPEPGGGTSTIVSFRITNPSDLSITNVVPGTAIAGGGPIQVTVHGTRFALDSAVLWNGQAVPHTFISSTQLTATISTTLLSTAGTAGITVFNPPPGGGTSNVFTFIINNPLPVLSSISPDGKSAGQPTFTLTLTGNNFVSASQVHWNGMVLPSTLISPTELQATVAANLIAIPGTVSVTVENPEPGGGIAVARTFTIGDQLTITTESPLPSGTIGENYSRTMSAVGGSPPYRWELAAGSQTPLGFSLNPTTGILRGTPTELGNYSLNIRVTDSLNVTVIKAFVLTISPTTFVITTASPLPNAQIGVPYTQTFAASGGTAPYVNWSVTGGQLPGGLTLNTANGTLSGTPNAAGNFTFMITVTDNAAETASKEFTLTVPPPGNVLTILTTACPAASVGVAYNCSFTASGGTPAYTWAITAGTLPAGLALNNTSGVISGTPQSVGEANLTIRVTDTIAATATQTVTINVTTASVTISLLGTPGPAQQNQVTLTLPQARSTAVTGEVALSFTPDPALPNGGAGLDDPAIQFSGNRQRTASFNVPAGSTEATFTGGNLMLQTGTIAGTVTVTLTSMRSGSSVITPSPAPTQSVVVARLAPVISSVRIVNRTAAGFSVEVTGYATPRDLTQAGFQFTGQNLQGAQATIQLGTVAQTWYASQASLAFGSLFTYTQPFTTSADPAGITSVSVTLTNSLGNSTAASANF